MSVGINPENKIKALGLTSGGLDSILAALVLRSQNIYVEWICFESPFFSCEKARQAADHLEIPLTVEDITEEFLPVVRQPACGYGQHMNPCLDCHALMAALAGRIMGQKQFDFVFSGEVVGQRPFSQTKSSLRYVEKHSGIDGYLLRPLSARLLPETIPEQEKWVDREELYELSGRSRKPQMALAETFGISEYPSPGGGCLLTDKKFAARLKDLFDHQDDCSGTDCSLLKHGRHFRLSPQAKLIVGRTRTDNQNLVQYRPTGPHCWLKLKEYAGPTCLLIGEAEQGVLMLAAGICAGYGKAPQDQPVAVEVTIGRKKSRVSMMGVPPEKIKHLQI